MVLYNSSTIVIVILPLPDLTMRRYINEVLRSHEIPMLWQMGRDFILMQGNARHHVAPRKYLEVNNMELLYSMDGAWRVGDYVIWRSADNHLQRNTLRFMHYYARTFRRDYSTPRWHGTKCLTLIHSDISQIELGIRKNTMEVFQFVSWFTESALFKAKLIRKAWLATSPRYV